MKSFFTKLGVLLLGVVFAVAGCQDYDEDIRKVNEQLNTNTAELTSITEQLDKAIKDLEAKLEADYATKKALADLSAELKAKDADIEAAIAALDAAYKAADVALKAGYEAADAKLKEDLEAQIAKAVKDAQDANDALALIFENSLNALNSEIAGVNSFINETLVPYFEGRIDAVAKALEDAQAALEGDIAKVAADLATAKTELTAAYEGAIADAVEELEDLISAQATELEALKTLHQNDVVLLQAAIAENHDDIVALSLSLKEHIDEYKVTVDLLQGAIYEGDEAVRQQLMNSLNAHIEIYETTVSHLEGAIGENTAAIEAVRMLVIDLTNQHKQDVAYLQAAIAENTTLAEGIRIQLINHINEYAATVEQLEGAIGENSAKITANLIAIRDLETLHKTDMEHVQNVLNVLDVALQQETAQRKEADEALQAAQDALAASFEAFKTQYAKDVDNLQAAMAEGDEAVRQQLIAMLTRFEEQYAKDIDNLQAAISEGDETVRQQLMAMLARFEEQYAKDIDNLQAAISEGDAAVTQLVMIVRSALEDHIAVYETTVSQLQGAIGENTAAIDRNFIAIKDLQAKDEEIDAAIADLDAAYKAADDQLTELINKNSSDIAAVNAKLEEVFEQLASYIIQHDMRLNVLESYVADLVKRLAAAEVNISVLTERVQSLVYVPEYNDAKATINYGLVPYITAEQKVETAIVPAKSVLRYKVNSTSETAVADIVRAFAQDPSILTYDLENVKLRSAAPELQVVSVREDEQGYLEVTALAKNFAKEFYYITLTEEVKTYLKQHISQNHPFLDKIFGLIFGSDWGTVEIITTQTPSTSYSAALVLAQADKKNNVASEFTNLIPAKNYGVLNLAARYTAQGKTVVVDSNFSDVVAERKISNEQFIPSYDTVTVVKTCANEPVIKVIGDDLYYTVTELYNKYGYAVELQKTHQVVSYTKDGKMDLTQQAAPAWNTELVSYNTDKFIVVDPAASAIGTSRDVSLTSYDEAEKVKYDQRVGNYLEVVDAYYLAGQTVAVADKVTITKNLVYINFEAKTYNWTLAKAIALRGDDDDKTPYAKSIVLNDVNYDNIYNINPIVSDAAATKTVTLNGKPNATVFELSDIVAPEAGKAGRADITIKAGYEFAAAKAENANEYVLTWKASLNETTDAIVTVKVTLGKYPDTIEVVSACDLDLVAGQTYFDGKDALIADAYAALGAELAGFAKDAKVNDIMFAALNDEANKPFINKPAPTEGDNMNFVVADNNDSSFVRLFNSQIDMKDVPAIKAGEKTYTLTRDIKTWFGVPFHFEVTATPHLPEIGLVRSTEYASATAEPKVYNVNLQARVTKEEGIYTVVQSDLAYYLNATGEVNATQSVSFAVIEGKGEIDDKVVALDPLTTAIPNPLLGVPVTAYLTKKEAILNWTDPGTQIKVKATLWAGAYPIDEAVLILNVEDPLTFTAGNITETRKVEKDTPVYVYREFALISTAKKYDGTLAHTGNLIKTDTKAEDITNISEIISADVRKAYGIDIKVEKVTIVEKTEKGDVLYDSSKYSWVPETGLLTLMKDDAAQLLNPIEAQLRVTFTHNVHGASDACSVTRDFTVTFNQPE